MPISIKGECNLLDNFKNNANNLPYIILLSFEQGKQEAPEQKRLNVQLNTKKQFKVGF